MNVADKVMGFVSFNPIKYLEARETHDWSIYYYAYSSKNVFDKGNYLLMGEGAYDRALAESYLVVVDGVFDQISLAFEGINSAALLGSTLTPQILMLLRFIPNIIVLADNDDAGLLLYEHLKKQHHGVRLFKQNYGKDADDVLKSCHRDTYLEQLRNFIACGMPVSLASF